DELCAAETFDAELATIVRVGLLGKWNYNARTPMKYRKILLAYNGSQEGKRALLECADLASFLGAQTHMLAVANMPPSLFLTEGFVPEELLEEEIGRAHV